MDLGLKDKVAIVTGSSRGLGLASARALAAEGALVCLCGRTQATLEAAVKEVGDIAGGPERVLGVRANVSHQDGLDHLVTGTVKVFGGIDILVNNVGFGGGKGLLDTTDGEWQEAFEQTLFPAVRASRMAVPYMRQRGGGAIVIIASIFGRESGGRMTYNAVKAAEISLGKSLAQQLAPDIRVNTVSPGSIAFPGGSWWTRQQADPEGMRAFVEREIPMGRFGSAEEVGDVVAFLCSSRASWINGTSVVVDGCQSRAF